MEKKMLYFMIYTSIINTLILILLILLFQKANPLFQTYTAITEAAHADKERQINANAYHDDVDANRNAVISDLNNLGAMAQFYYKKPASMGGGSNTFTGWTIPKGLASDSSGSYEATVTAQRVTITGTGTENGDSGSKLVHTATVTPTEITVAKLN